MLPVPPRTGIEIERSVITITIKYDFECLIIIDRDQFVFKRIRNSVSKDKSRALFLYLRYVDSEVIKFSYESHMDLIINVE
jgi:hypothetical protein